MNRTLAQTKRPRRRRYTARNRLLYLFVKARGRYIDRLLKKWSIERIGLIKQRQHFQLSMCQQTLQSNLATRDKVLDQKGVRVFIKSLLPQDFFQALENSDELGRVIRSNDASTPRETTWLEYTWI